MIFGVTLLLFGVWLFLMPHSVFQVKVSVAKMFGVKMTGNKKVLAAYKYIGLVLTIIGALLLMQPATTPAVPMGACTMEAKICPDGSAVGRTGPSCEFSPCPGE